MAPHEQPLGRPSACYILQVVVMQNRGFKKERSGYFTFSLKEGSGYFTLLNNLPGAMGIQILCLREHGSMCMHTVLGSAL